MRLPRFDPADRARIERERKQLTDYAIAVNEVRRPFQRSLHDVIGEISKLNGYPLIPLPNVDTTGLDAIGFERVEDFAAQLSRTWAPVDRGDDFLWRDLVQRRTASSAETDYGHRVSRLRTALEDLQRASVTSYEDLWIAGKPTPATAPWLQELLRLVESKVGRWVEFGYPGTRSRPPQDPRGVPASGPQTGAKCSRRCDQRMR